MENNTIFCNIEALSVSVPVIFNSTEILNTIIPVVSETISTIRLPNYTWDKKALFNETEPVKIEASIKNKDLTVKFDCQLFGGFYTLDISGFHWDFWKVIIASFSKELTKRNGFVSHAACANINGKTILFPGHSGAGKSSVSFACLEKNIPVYASELCFIQNGKLIAGNLHASIDEAALMRYKVSKPIEYEVKANRILANIFPLESPLKIDRVIFPNVRKGEKYIREISGRRARMLLYENVFAQLPSGQMVNQVQVPISPLPTKEELETISNQLVKITKEKSYIIEGEPKDLVNFLINLEEYEV